MMEQNTIEYTHPAFGAEFWRDLVVTHGQDEAIIIGEDYLKLQLKKKLPPEEHQFCRAFFAAMYEATAGRADPAKLVYPYPVREANERGERSAYFESRDHNGDCAATIDNTINNSSYEPYHYNLDIAAMAVVQRYGFQRVNAVLAYCFQTRAYDGRFSTSNKQWAQGFDLPEKAFSRADLGAHPVLVEDFANHVRKLYDEMGAERFALPGQPESGEAVERYEITRAITFEDGSGFAMATHPTAGYVCWQFKTDGGKRDYFWGHYCNDEKDAANNYLARIAVHMSGSEREEPQLSRGSSEPQPPPHRKPKDRGER